MARLTKDATVPVTQETRTRFQRAVLRAYLGMPTRGADLVAVALEAVLQGADGSALVALASMSNPTLADTFDVLEGAAAEMGVSWPADRDSARAALLHSYPWIVDAVTPILHDVGATLGDIFKFEILDEDEDGDVSITVRDATGWGVGFTLSPDLTDADACGMSENSWRAIARISEMLMELTSDSWPDCVLHPNVHPMSLTNGTWICPSTGAQIARLGELPSTEV